MMLPDSTQARLSNNKGKFVDTAVPALIAEMSKLGADRSRLVAKIVGGQRCSVLIMHLILCA